MKTLITFVHLSGRHGVYLENLEFFIKCGLLDHQDYHYNFVFNGHECSIDIPKLKNVSIIKRDNKGYDFGAYEDSVSSINIEEYDYFIFFNDTARGPFVPSYIPSSLTWVDLFLDKLNEKIKLVGPLASFSHAHHLQSCSFGTDLTGLKLLRNSPNKFIISEDLLRGLPETKDEIIIQHEIGMSQRIINAGYEIKGFNCSQHESVKVQTEAAGIHNMNAYYGTTIHPLEIMFIKSNRIKTKCVKNHTRWALQNCRQK